MRKHHSLVAAVLVTSLAVAPFATASATPPKVSAVTAALAMPKPYSTYLIAHQGPLVRHVPVHSLGFVTPIGSLIGLLNHITPIYPRLNVESLSMEYVGPMIVLRLVTSNNGVPMALQATATRNWQLLAVHIIDLNQPLPIPTPVPTANPTSAVVGERGAQHHPTPAHHHATPVREHHPVVVTIPLPVHRPVAIHHHPLPAHHPVVVHHHPLPLHRHHPHPPVGPSGPTGVTTPPGVTGSTGAPTGSTGSTGPTGGGIAWGPTGPSGVTGAPSGSSGSTGTSGSTGASGPSGPTDYNPFQFHN